MCVVNVLLFSNEDLAFKMTESMQLIHVLICSVTSLVKKSPIDNPMTGKLANRVDHISVQLFSNEDLGFKMTESMQLIHVLICSVTSLVKKSLIDNPYDR